MGTPRTLRILLGVFVLSVIVAVGIGFTTRGDSSSSGSSTTKHFIRGLDVERATTVSELVNQSSLIMYGTPSGPATFKQLTSTGGDYYQTVQVKAVYKGAASGSVRVLRFGPPEGSGVVAEDAGGRLLREPAVYFLQPSAKSGVYQVTGHTQGVLVVGPEGRIVDVGKYGFPALQGLAPEAVKDRVLAE